MDISSAANLRFWNELPGIKNHFRQPPLHLAGITEVVLRIFEFDSPPLVLSALHDASGSKETQGFHFMGQASAGSCMQPSHRGSVREDMFKLWLGLHRDFQRDVHPLVPLGISPALPGPHASKASLAICSPLAK